MNKYLRGFLNFIIGLFVLFAGLLFTGNILTIGFLFLPELLDKVNIVLISYPSWFTFNIIPGTLPLFFLLITFSLAAFSMFLTLKLIGKVDIEKILDAIRVAFLTKEAKSE